MKKLFFLTLVALAWTAGAQITHTANGQVDENAQRVLKKAYAKVNTNAVSMSVTMINYNADKKETARQSAKVVYNKGKYHVAADGQDLYCNGTAVYHWNSKANEVVISPMSDADIDLMNPAKLLSNYSKNFRPKYIRQEDNGTAIIDMIPLKRMSYHKIRLYINAQSGILSQMEIHNYDSSCGTYKVSEFKSGVKCSDSDFNFDLNAHKGVEVIDMR